MYLGIDVGTSGVKAVIVSRTGDILAQATAPLIVSRPAELWSEQDPDDWWIAVERAVGRLDGALRRQVLAVGLSGQMHGATLLGADDRPLRPAILWNDGRSFAQCPQLAEREPRSLAITGNLAMPGFTAPKLLWIRQHEPEVFAKITSVLLPKDYVRLQMTGDKASDLSDAAGTLWLDVGARSWSEPMLAATGLTREQMPALHEGCEATGRLRSDVAERWGMGEVPVAAGGGDNAAGAAGVGVVAEGDAFLSLGTSGVIFVATAAFRANPAQGVHTFCHCIPAMWHQMAVHLSAASCVDWATRTIGVAGAQEFFAVAEQIEPGEGSEIFLPYLSGERTPHNDPHVRAAFLGIGNETTAAHLAAAVLEGVAFAHADGLDALRAGGSRVDHLAVIGGGARSRHWGRILAATLGVPLVYSEGGEVGPAVGAAKLAQIAVSGAPVEQVCTKPPIAHVVEPESALIERLAPKMARFRAASAAIRALDKE